MEDHPHLKTPAMMVRMHKGAEKKAFRCVCQEEDDTVKMRVSLSKDLMAIKDIFGISGLGLRGK